MSIKIKTEKVVVDGEMCRRIISVDGVRSDTPHIYRVGEYISTLSSGDGIYCSVGDNMQVGDTTREEDFQKSLEYCRKCGEKLHRINEEIQKLKETWKGEETFVV